jgi:ubiquinone/menaquinone biosynthesis C-methylase UbiE
MKMNYIEKAAMNNPFRALIQKWYEAPLMERLGGRTEGLKVLEIGCGRGVGTELIFKRFGAKEVHSFDIDPDMINKARKRLSDYPPDRLRLTVGDVTAIEAEDASYDIVFDFWILHHVPIWQNAVAEISRVLKPGGRFFFQELTKHALNRLSYRIFLEHPKENRFSLEEFVYELERQGIIIGKNVVERIFGDFFFGVGHRVDSSQKID